METVRELYHPEAIVRSPADFPEPGPYVGRDAVMRQFEQLRETFDADKLEPITDFRSVGNHVIVRWIWHTAGRGPDTGLEVTSVYTMRGGRVFEMEYFRDHDEALEAVGLRESAMSRENVEVVRMGIDAWNAGDLERLRKGYHPDVVMYHLEGWPEPGPSVGRDAVMRQWESQRENLDIDAVEPVSEFIEAGDRVIVRYAWRGTGLGPDLNMEFTGVHTLRNGTILVQEWFWDHSEALEAVGLSE